MEDALHPLYLSCHCQSNVYRVLIPAAELIQKAVVFDCSQCIKRRGLWAFVDPAKLQHLRGYNGPGVSLRAFCHTCSSTLLRFPYRVSPVPPYNETIGINLRAVRTDDVSLFDAHEIVPKLIKDEHPPGFSAVTFVDVPGADVYLNPQPGEQIHLAACPCKSICFAWKGKAIEEDPAWDCGCSICLGNGVVWIDPGRQNTYFYPHDPTDPSTPRQDLITKYTFGTHQNGHFFCNRCGVEIYEYNPSKGKDGWALNLMLAGEAPNFLVDLYHLPSAVFYLREGQKRIPKYVRHVWMRKQGDPYVVHVEEHRDEASI